MPLNLEPPKFNLSFNALLGFEGAYSDDPDDKGGETYFGISRVSWPRWEGWVLIDSLKMNWKFPDCLNDYMELNESVRRFYLENYWNENHCEELLDHAVAFEVFEMGVNCGVATAAVYLQQALNLLNLNGQRWPDIEVDGRVGPQTIGILTSCLAMIPAREVGNLLNGYQVRHYINNGNEKYIRGWMKRVTITWG